MYQHPAPDSGASHLITDNFTQTGKSHPHSVYPIEFTGSGSEYFRIWLVNLLLLFLTLGLYYPWAKVRKLRYFYGNTVVAGHPLDFHGNPKQMLRGFLLVAVLMGLYSFAGQVSPMAGAISGLILAVLWPALLRASLQFRLANTSWRGLRFGFNGSLKDAYMVMLVPAAVMAGLALLSTLLIGLLSRSMGPWAQLLAALPLLIGGMAVGPYVWWRIKRYQHAHYALGTMQTNFRATFGDMVGVFVKSGLIGLGCLTLALISIGLMLSGNSLSSISAGDKVRPEMITNIVVPAMVIAFVLVQLVQGPYFVSRMQNLVWTQTGNRRLRFKSQLGLGPLVWITFKNWALTVLTLGLYWPFAAVALARVKLEAVAIHTRQDLDLMVAQNKTGHRDAAGDLAADMLGIDFGI